MTHVVATVLVPKSGWGESTNNDDRVEVVHHSFHLAVLVADGATGVGDGWKASGMLADAFLADLGRAASSVALRRVLEDADRMVAKAFEGEADTTGIALVCEGDRVLGASAGDSEAWLLGAMRLEVTSQQVRKPRIGSGARVTTFDVPFLADATLVVASDGLWEHVAMDDVERAVASDGDVRSLSAALVDLVRERNEGRLPDDVAIAVVRRT